MTRARFLSIAVVVVLLGAGLRSVWLTADPPTTDQLGIVFHDEGAWTHNARNRALFDHWRLDEWNPVFIAPVFTALEYGAFRTFGVGTWQARTVPVASGLVALIALMAGLAAIAGRRTAIIGGLFLATNYAWVMWNRAALMESTMTSFVVVGWAAYALSERRPVWGLVSGAAAALAWFTKASAAFFVAALAADAVATIVMARLPGLRSRLDLAAPSPALVRGAVLTIAGLAAAGGLVAMLFVWTHWTDYWFYNVQTSVLRKPSYDIASLIDRASWLPIVTGFFSRMWLVLAGATIALLGILARWRAGRPAERLLVLWVAFGLLELIVHDSGDERYYVMLIPALVALAARTAGSVERWLPEPLGAGSPVTRALMLPVLAGAGYLLVGSLVRLAFPHDVSLEVGNLKAPVRISAALATVAAGAVLVFWRGITAWFGGRRITAAAATVLVALTAAWDLGLFAHWATGRTYLNYEASVELGRLLPPGTLVQGKLANGLALENEIRPIFVGRGFGNYADRFERDDARYILTYDLPWIGYESQRGLIDEILDRYPNRRIVATFDVNETPGADRAVLIDKHPDAPGAADSSRARD